VVKAGLNVKKLRKSVHNVGDKNRLKESCNCIIMAILISKGLIQMYSVCIVLSCLH